MWMDIVVVVFLLCGVYGFVELVGWRTRGFNRKTTRTAEDLYDSYADSPRKQRRYAREHGGQWRDDEAVPPSDAPTHSRPPG